MTTRAFTRAVAAFALLASACGSRPSDEGPTTVSQARLCAGASPVDSDGTATTHGCPFEQQLYNISVYGSATADEVLRDGDGAALATVNAACDTWRVGTDGEGVTVIIDTASGAVRSHGMFHAGQPTSTLPATAALPISAR